MATYLCVKVNNTTKKFTAKESKEAGKPYLRVPGGYFPLTTETTTGTQLKVRANNTNYRIVETYKTTINTTTNTTTTVQAQLSSSVTTSENGTFYKTQVHSFHRTAYKVLFTKGEFVIGRGQNLYMIIDGFMPNSQMKYSSFYIATATKTCYMNFDQTISKTGVIYIDNDTAQNFYINPKNNPFISTYKNVIGMINIANSLESSSIMNITNMNEYTKTKSLTSNGSSFHRRISKIYGNFYIQENYGNEFRNAIMENIFNPADVVISTENYTYETETNTVVNTTIETTSQ